MSKNENKEALKTYRDLLTNQSSKLYKIARTYIYALLALVWSLHYKNGEFILPDKKLEICLLALIFSYVVIDFFQYFAVTCNLRYQIYLLSKNIKNGNAGDATDDKINKLSDCSTKRSLFMFVLRMILVFVISILFACCIISRTNISSEESNTNPNKQGKVIHECICNDHKRNNVDCDLISNVPTTNFSNDSTQATDSIRENKL